MVDRRHRELLNEDVEKITEVYHQWRNLDSGESSTLNGELQNEEHMLLVAEDKETYDGYKDIKGFCKSATIEEIRAHEYVLTPGRYVGIEDVEGDGIPFEEKMNNMTSELAELFAKSRHLEEEIRKNLGGIGYGI